MKTEFKVSVWRNYYDQVKILGEYLKDSRPDRYGNPPKFTISLIERKDVEEEIDGLLKMADNYLDKCGLLPKEPKWHYDRTKQTTWASSETFLFQPMVSKKKYVKIVI